MFLFFTFLYSAEDVLERVTSAFNELQFQVEQADNSAFVSAITPVRLAVRDWTSVCLYVSVCLSVCRLSGISEELHTPTPVVCFIRQCTPEMPFLDVCFRAMLSLCFTKCMY